MIIFLPNHHHNVLRMSATERSYTQNFSKVPCIVIQAILGQKLMKNFTAADEKIFCLLGF